MSASVVDDPGRPNSPGSIDAGCIIWERLVPRRWWRNSHAKASKPLAFSNASGRFSDPKLAFGTLYLGSNPITCFWECGLGRNARFPSDRTITEDDLVSRIEYLLTLNPDPLRVFNVSNSAARRSIGALTSACFGADHSVSQQWAQALVGAGTDGILYPSARATDGICLALFENPGTLNALGFVAKIGCSFENPSLLASLFKEQVCLLQIVLC
jgi:hypothetical protein